MTKTKKINTPLKTHGGKFYLATRIVALMPKHTRYLEPYAGGLSVLLAKPFVGVSEYVNDLNGELTNFWKVLKETPDALLRALWATPVSQTEFFNATQYLADTGNQDAMNRATAFFVRARQSRQGLGKDYATPTSRQRRGMNETCSAWWSAIEGLPEVHNRLKRVEIYNTKAVELAQSLDSPDLLGYFDPPYLHSTRSTKTEYGKFEMDEKAHAELLDTACMLKAKVMISGYPSELYSQKLKNWERVEFPTANHASSSKTKEVKIETVWKNF
jgi:DNA adenine methylase